MHLRRRAEDGIPGLPEPVQVHHDRRQPLAGIDDRSSAPRHVMQVEHGSHGPAQARDAVRRWSVGLDLGDVRDDLLLVVSELVTNAVRHGAPPLRLELEAAAGVVTVAVVDGAPGRPVARDADADAEGGRGLLLIELLAADRGVRPVPPGKAVWAAVARP